MSLSDRDLSLLLATLVDPLRTELKREIQEEIAGRVESFRRAVYVRDEWCCNELTIFATEVWGAAKPRTRDTVGTVAYMLRHRTVNYCPFCVVSFLAPHASQT